MKQHGVILLLLSIFLCAPACKQAQQEKVPPQEKSPVQEQTQKKSMVIPGKEAGNTPHNPMKL